MKKNILLLTLLLGISIILLITANAFDRADRPDAPPPVSDRTPHIEISMSDENVSLAGAPIEDWITWKTDTVELYNRYRPLGRIYFARSVAIQWGVFDIPDGSFIRKQYFDLSTDKSFRDARRYNLRSGERSIELQNLLVDSEYFFRITLELENNQGCIAEGTFSTKWSPRILEFENLRNIRDVGGWKTADGKSVKQGLLYRGCELDGATEENYQITTVGKDIMLDDLKIKSEFDLRPKLANARDALGETVTHRYFDLPSYAGCFTDNGNQKLADVFAALADEKNYPIYLHCTEGSDRTGIVCYLLGALLGMSEEDCYRDWELSLLATGSAKYEQMDRFVQMLHRVDGETLQEKTENYLLSIGVTGAQIENIRAILVG